MTTLFLLFNHSLTDFQKADAQNSLNVENIENPPEDVRNLWSKIPADIENIFYFLSPVRQWLDENAKERDILLVQGDFGATYLMVDFALKSKLTPVYSTTARSVIEKELENGHVNIEHHFCHVRYRRYGK